MSSIHSIRLFIACVAAFALAFAVAVIPAAADHSSEAQEASHATTVHKDDDHGHEDDHGVGTAIVTTDVAQLKAYVALLEQLIALLAKQIELTGGTVHIHDDGAAHIHDDDHDEANDDNHDTH